MSVFCRATIGFNALILLARLLAATEIGFRAGRRRRVAVDEAAKSQIGTIQGAALGLLGLLMASTLSMAVSRFEYRIQLVLSESNVIGTTELRARLLPEPDRQEFQDLLRRYVEVRLEYREAGVDTQLVQAAIRKTEELQGQLWSRASAIAEKDPRAVTTGLLLQSLNEAGDLVAQLLVVAAKQLVGLTRPLVVAAKPLILPAELLVLPPQRGHLGLERFQPRQQPLDAYISVYVPWCTLTNTLASDNSGNIFIFSRELFE